MWKISKEELPIDLTEVLNNSLENKSFFKNLIYSVLDSIERKNKIIYKKISFIIFILTCMILKALLDIYKKKKVLEKIHKLKINDNVKIKYQNENNIYKAFILKGKTIKINFHEIFILDKEKRINIIKK